MREKVAKNNSEDISNDETIKFLEESIPDMNKIAQSIPPSPLLSRSARKSLYNNNINNNFGNEINNALQK